MSFINSDTHAAKSSFGCLDARTKLISVIIFVAAVAFLTGLPALAAALVYALFLAALSGVPVSHFAKRYALAFPFVLLASLSALMHSGVPAAVAMLLRVSASVLALLVLSCTTPFFEILKGLQALRVPLVFVALLLFTHRYISIFSDELGRLSLARRARGAQKGRHLLDRSGMRLLSFTAGMVLFRAYHRGTRLGEALRVRGFDGRIRTLNARPVGAAEVLFSAALVALSVFLLYADRGGLRWLTL
ncbi:MAG: energy-coupling factor transporter transmembrane component T [Thermoplasmata archaeon]